MQKKVAIIAVFLVIFTTLSSYSAIAPTDQEANSGCCINEDVPFVCQYPAFPKEPLNKYATVEDCCGQGITSCDKFKGGTSCDIIPECNIQLQDGCCTDTCTTGKQSSCTQPDNWQDLQCNEVLNCAKGCCICVDKTASNNPTYAVNFVSKDDCANECKNRKLVDILDGTVTPHSIWSPQLKTSCSIDTPIIEPTITVNGEVRDSDGKALQGATVVINGIAQTETVSDGKYILTTIPRSIFTSISQNNIAVYKSKYIGNTTFLSSIPALSSTATSIEINFTLSPAIYGIISGKVTESNTQSTKIRYATIEVRGLADMQRYLTDEDGNFILYYPSITKTYNVTALSYGYSPSSQDVELISGTSLPEVIFRLAKKQPSSLNIIVKDGKDGITPLSGVKVTILDPNTPLQRFTKADGKAPFGGSLTTDNLYEGTYRVEVFLPSYELNYSIVKIIPWWQTLDQNINEFTVFLNKINDLCSYNGESFKNNTCSLFNKPYFCRNGDIANSKNEVVLNCTGSNGIAGDSDDCCSSEETCQTNGYCTPKNSLCISTCTYRNSDICRKECNGISGCSFYNETVMNLCTQDNRIQIGEMITYGDATVKCCDGLPRPKLIENCTDVVDNDDDNGNGIVNDDDIVNDIGDLDDVNDPDCYNQNCDPNDKLKTWLPLNSNTLECRRRPCSSGYIAQNDIGCQCGRARDDFAPLQDATVEGQYCCDLDNILYSNDASFRQSPCGNTACKLANQGNEESIPAGKCCINCQGSTNPALAGESCGANNNLKCCEQCMPDSASICDYRAQCPEGEVSAGVDPYLSRNVPCNKLCIPIKTCAINQLISSPAADPAANNPICSCNGRIFDSSNRGSDNPYCCRGSDGNIQVSSEPCTPPPEVGKINGTVKDTFGNAVEDARICLRPDYCFVPSTDRNGNYEIAVQFDTEYTLYAYKTGYKDYTNYNSLTSPSTQSPSDYIQLSGILSSSSSTQTLNFNLLKNINPCLDQKPPVIQFYTNHTLGNVKKIILTWQPPVCPSGSIVGYIITRKLSTGSDPETFPLIEPYKNTISDSGNNPQFDTQLQYNSQYEYSIKVKYANLISPDDLSEAKTSTIKVGDALCEGRYKNGALVQFCDLAAEKLIAKKQCDINNTVYSLDVSTWCEPTTQVCTGPNLAGNAICKNFTECGPRKQNAFPFGLYFERDSCLGINYLNNCYYDYYKSNDANPNKLTDIYTLNPPEFDTLSHHVTPFDKCINCPVTKTSGMSCFNYRSEDACKVDNCNLGNGEACSWTNASYSEFGLGYCYLANYSNGDKCNLCSPGNDIFFNTRCTQDLCSKLGSCFTTESENKCLSCNNAKCEDFKTEQICTNNVPLAINASAKINYSKDACNLGRCKWKASENRCYKDGNDDNKSDCILDELKNIDLSLNTDSDADNCKKDNTATLTKLKNKAIDSIGGNTADLVFSAGSATDAYRFFFCIDKINEPASCYPGARSRNNNIQAGGEIPYGASNEVTLSISTLKIILKAKGYIDRDIYYLRYFTTDKSYNQEDVQSIPFYIDIWPPDISLRLLTPVINLEGTPINANTKSKLSFTIHSNEEVKCTDSFAPNPLPQQIRQIKSNIYTTDFDSEFNVTDGIYKYTVTCYDKSNNKLEKSIEGIYVDAFSDITIESPASPTRTNPISNVFNGQSILFKVKTTDQSVCRLVHSHNLQPVANDATADFLPDATKLTHTLTYNIPDSDVRIDSRISANPIYSSKVYHSQHYPITSTTTGAITGGYSVKCTNLQGSKVEDTKMFDFTIDQTPPNTTLRAKDLTSSPIFVRDILDDQFFIERGKNLDLNIICQELQIDGSDQVFGKKPNSEKICVKNMSEASSCNDLKNFGSGSGIITISSNKRVCFTCEDNGNNIAPPKCGNITVDKNPPNLFLDVYNDTTENGKVTKLLLRSPSSNDPRLSKVYRIEVESNEELKNESNLIALSLGFIIKRVNGSLSVIPDYGLNFSKKQGFTVRNQFFYEANFSVPSLGDQFSDYFDKLDSNDSVKLIITGKDKFGNTRILTKNYTVDTDAPGIPNWQRTDPVTFFSSSAVDEPGFEADRVPNMNIIVEYGNRPNILKHRTITLNGITVNAPNLDDERSALLQQHAYAMQNTVKQTTSSIECTGEVIDTIDADQSKTYTLKDLSAANPITLNDIRYSNGFQDIFNRNDAISTCSDTDGLDTDGLGYNTRGFMSVLIPSEGKTLGLQDTCIGNKALREAKCADTLNQAYEDYTCQNLCYLGACIAQQECPSRFEIDLKLDEANISQTPIIGTIHAFNSNNDNINAIADLSISKDNIPIEIRRINVSSEGYKTNSNELLAYLKLYGKGSYNLILKSADTACNTENSITYINHEKNYRFNAFITTEGTAKYASFATYFKNGTRLQPGQSYTFDDGTIITLASITEFTGFNNKNSMKFCFSQNAQNQNLGISISSSATSSQTTSSQTTSSQTTSSQTTSQKIQQTAPLSKNSITTLSTPDPNLLGTIKLGAVLEGDKVKLKDIGNLNLANRYLEFPNITLPNKKFYKVNDVLDPAVSADKTILDTIQTNTRARHEAKIARDEAKRLANEATATNGVLSTDLITRSYTVSSSILTALGNRDEANSTFISLNRVLYGLENIRDEGLDTQTTYNPNLTVNVYQRAEPLGWFNAHMDLEEGSTWLYAYAIDENGNIGLPTDVKKIIVDSTSPEILHYGPADDSVINAELGVNIFATFRDLNSGINIKLNTAALTINGEKYNCNDYNKYVQCQGTKTFTISLFTPLQDGPYNITASVKDELGNSQQQNWTFYVNNRYNEYAPSDIIADTLTGFCIKNDKCYVNTTKPEFGLFYWISPIEAIGTFTTDKMLSIGVMPPIRAIIEDAFYYLNATPLSELTEGKHNLDLIHKGYANNANNLADTGYDIADIADAESNPDDSDAEIADAEYDLANMVEVEYPNSVKFVIDTTPPEISIDNLTLISSKSIDITGIYEEENVYEIRFSGDIIPTDPLTFRELPTDIINKNISLFLKNIVLDISNSSKPIKEIKITILDKAGNSKEVSLLIYYDITPPELANITIQTIDSQKIVVELNKTSYLTNSIKVKISGATNKPLFNLRLSSVLINSKPIAIDPVTNTFSVELDLSTLSQTPKKYVLLQAEDEVGNEMNYILSIKLDTDMPNVMINII